MKTESVSNTIQYEEAAAAVQSILARHFNIPPDQFAWDKPLNTLCKDFEILSYLIYLEQLLNEHFQKKTALLENISADFHTPRDVLILITRNL